MPSTINSTEKSSLRGRGRPKKDTVAQHFTMPAELAARIDAWAQKQVDEPGRPEAIRRLIEAGLGVPQSKMAAPSAPSAPPYKFGDRVSHSVFGIGVVAGDPVPLVAGDAETGGTLDSGWAVPVEFNDPAHGAVRVKADGLKPAPRPSAMSRNR